MLRAADEHHRRQQRLALLTVKAGKRAWKLLDLEMLDNDTRYLSALLQVLVSAQANAAEAGAGYVARALAEQDAEGPTSGRVNAAAFAGIAADGRGLPSLLREPVIRVKQAIGQGFPVREAMFSGRSSLTRILHTEVADAGRVAAGVAIASRPGVGYTRMLVGKTCGRCANLAGRYYRFSAGFARHPGCDCIHVPTRGAAAARSEGLITDPQEHFKSLTVEEQDRAYTKAGAQAIRDGADPSQVVNARRGMSVAGTTTEGTTRRGLAHRPGSARLMPEAIYRQASSHAETVRLLRLHGYLI